MTCKLVALNTEDYDHLHFGREDIASIGESIPDSTDCAVKFINKVTATAYGSIFDRQVVECSESRGEYMVILTLKHVDLDPIVSISGSIWLTRGLLTIA